MTADLERRRQRIAELLLQAETERLVLGHLVDDYTHVTGPFDRFYNRAVNVVRTRPITTTLLLGLGGIAATRLAKRLPILGLIRGATLATTVLRSLRGPR